MTSLTGNPSLVTKVYFPREVLPTAAVFTKIVDLGFGLVILAGIMVYYGHPPEATAVWVPLLAVPQVVALGILANRLFR